MDQKIEEMKRLDRLILAELNIKVFARRISSKTLPSGVSVQNIEFCFDGERYYLTVDGIEVASPKTVEHLTRHFAEKYI